MKAVTYQGAKDVQVKEVPDAKIEKPDDIIVRITSTSSFKTLSGDPEVTSSKLGAAILIPAAATTSSTFWNFFLESLISSKGNGLKIDLIFVVNTSFVSS